MKEIDITLIKPNPDNPRTIDADMFIKLVKSITDFPQMLKIRPLVIDENNVLLGGNMRFKALKELGYTKVPTIQIGELTDEQKREFIIKDNVGFGDWDWNVLANEWDEEKLQEWGLEIKGFEPENESKGAETEEKCELCGK